MVTMQAEPPQMPNVKHKGPKEHPNLSGTYPARGALLGHDKPQMTHTQGHGCRQKAFTGLEACIDVTSQRDLPPFFRKKPVFKLSKK